MEIENDEKEKKKYGYFIYLFLFTVILFFCVFGVTYSVYKPQNTDNEVETGDIIFNYSDVAQAGNGISLMNAIPISDNRGMNMVGNHQYFDFNIMTTTKKNNLHYQILINKDKISTLKDENVRIYLTQVMGSTEKRLVLDTFSNLKQKEIDKNKYYVIYEKTLDKNLENYSDSFRLRMWVKEDAINYEDQIFSVKVDVYAYKVGD